MTIKEASDEIIKLFEDKCDKDGVEIEIDNQCSSGWCPTEYEYYKPFEDQKEKEEFETKLYKIIQIMMCKKIKINMSSPKKFI